MLHLSFCLSFSHISRFLDFHGNKMVGIKQTKKNPHKHTILHKKVKQKPLESLQKEFWGSINKKWQFERSFAKCKMTEKTEIRTKLWKMLLKFDAQQCICCMFQLPHKIPSSFIFKTSQNDSNPIEPASTKFFTTNDYFPYQKKSKPCQSTLGDWRLVNGPGEMFHVVDKRLNSI